MIQRILAWPLRKDDTHTSRSVTNFVYVMCNNNISLQPSTASPAAQAGSRPYFVIRSAQRYITIILSEIYYYYYYYHYHYYHYFYF